MALAELVNYQHRLPFAAHWGRGATSSSDGQRFPVGGHGEHTGSVNLRYGTDPGITFYTHISDQYAPFHTKVINATVRDATFVLEGLLYHESDVRIEEHYTDTLGFTDHVFFLCHALGFRFAPRIRDIADRRLYVPSKARDYPHLAMFIETAGLNKGELKNTLSRAVCFNRLGELRDRIFDAQRYRASGLNLVVAAIIFWNTVYLNRAIDALSEAGRPFDAAWLPHLAPVHWDHINLTGDYSWRPNKRVEKGGFRPMRPTRKS